jgi:hypothetical protein
MTHERAGQVGAGCQTALLCASFYRKPRPAAGAYWRPSPSDFGATSHGHLPIANGRRSDVGGRGSVFSEQQLRAFLTI